MTKRTLKEALKHRRSYYALSAQSLISDEEIENIIRFTVENMPSAFNSQSARLVLLLGKEHRQLWKIVKETLKQIVSEPAFEATEAKINKSFDAGYGTVLFFEDQAVIEAMQNAFPLYKDKFPEWSEHSSAIHQFAVWTLLEDAGFGASLQHYNPLINSAVQAHWHLPPHWRLIAQMPFGVPIQSPGPKEMKPLEDRVRVFGKKGEKL